MVIPDKDSVLKIHYELVDMFVKEEDPIEPPGLRAQGGEGLLEMAVSRPHTGLGGVDKYSTYETKVGALFHSLIQNHAFNNGNKRTALVSLLVTLDLNGRRIEISDDEVFDFVVAVAAHTSPYDSSNVDKVVEEIATWIRRNSTARNTVPSSMRLNDFLGKCTEVGCNVRESADNCRWIIQNPISRKSIRIRKNNSTLDGPVIKQYVNRLGLSEANTGVYLDEFQNGKLVEQQYIIRYRNVLNRLAHA
ncbi:type II toxin-antitoxin system death-on-curing family toxin [Saccharibacillus qingshengii]|uniref:type II toxin-antitoxin system death-on-curing family toxin n=1 Tax=Saccharibacillus qingshengii TaxID=1763540 RepID=UPI0015539AC6|nr:type II toxin-antitoxin system death-on-curing family toxin [Saccharibacillus qingshengii]